MARLSRISLAALIGAFVVVFAFAGPAFGAIGLSAEQVTDAAADGTSSFKASTSLWTRVKQNMAVGFFNFTSVNMEQANQAYGRLEAYNYFNFDYKFDRSRKISFRPVFMWSTGGGDFKGDYKPGDLRIGDAFINYIDYNFLPMPWDMEFAAQFRFYAPTSSDSAERGMIMRIRPWFILSKDFTRSFSISINFEPDYYVQSRTGFVDDRGFVKGNRNYGYESSIEADYSFSRRFGAQLSAGHEESWAHTVPSEGVHNIYHQEYMTLDASVNVSLYKIFVVAGIGQKREISRPRGEFELLRGDEAQYYMLSSLRF